MKRYLPDESATIELGRALSDALPDEIAGWTILLEGELGAGKSTLARALVQSLGRDGPVPSPTYTIVEPYRLSRGDLYHVDLYRIGSEDELYHLGWSDLETGCRLVEWPDRAPGLRSTSDIEIRLDYSGDGREIEVTALSPRAEDVVSRIQAKPKT